MALTETPDGFLLSVKATPKAAKNEILPYQVGEPALRIKITTAPEDGKANAAIITLIAKKLGIAKSCLQMVQGEKSRQKVILIPKTTSSHCDNILLEDILLKLTGH
jgi:uncharacterized protein